MEWEEQIAAISMYLKHGYYPDSILQNRNVMRRKKLKRDFHRTTEIYKFIDNNLRKLKICRKFKDATSESKQLFVYSIYSLVHF